MGCRKITYNQAKDTNPFTGIWKGEAYKKSSFFTEGHLAEKSRELKKCDYYYPFGGSIAALSSTAPLSKPNAYKYQGKEEQTDFDLNTYDFHARMYDPILGRTFQQDPMGEMFYTFSPYSWAANNPISYVDPTGMVIEEGSQKEWDKQKQSVQNRRDNLQGRIDKLNAKAEEKGWSAEKLAGKVGNLTERVASLDGTLSTMGTLESSEQVYELNAGATDNQVSYDNSTGNIVISYSGTSLFVHETTHAGQFETGDIAFDSSTGNTLAQDVYDEVAGYKSQWAYDPTSVGNLGSSSEITPSWVQGISKPNGDQPYKPGGSANTGVAPVNINSNRDALIRAYPHLRGSLKGLPANATLKSIVPSMYYKK